MALETLFAPAWERRGNALDDPQPPSALSVPPLPRLDALRAELTRLHGHIVRLRCEDPAKGSRASALAYVDRQVARLADESVAAGGTEDGWHDPEDDLAAGDQVEALRVELAELTDAGAAYPLPLPSGCHLLPILNFDLLENGRLGNGKRSFGIASGRLAENGVSHLPMQRFATVSESADGNGDDAGWEVL